MKNRRRSDEERLATAAREYRTEGFSILPVFGPAEVTAWRGECDRLAAAIEAHDEEDRRVQARDHGTRGRIRDRLDPVSAFSAHFAELAVDPRLLEIASRVLDGPAALFKNRLILKTPGTAGYGLHRDWPYWAFLDVPPDRFVSVILSVDSSDATNGAIEIYAGLHESELPVLPEEPRDLDPRGVAGSEPRVAATSAGDALLLHPMAPHRSGANRSGRPRRQLTYVYVRAEHREVGERYYRENPERG